MSAHFIPVAEHWHTVAGEELVPRAVDLVLTIATAMGKVIESFLSLRAADATTSGQRQQMAWDLRHRVIVDWLGKTGPRDLNAAALT